MTDSCIAYQGERGSNSDLMCRAHFPDYAPRPFDTFEAAFDAARSGSCALAMIPLENSIAGRVADVHHLLPRSGLRIIGERYMRIRFDLMANPGTRLEDVRVVGSHIMGLAQCRNLLRKHGFTAETMSDTAGAARLLAEHPDPARAALAPPGAAALYGLETLLQGVEDRGDNTTRFVILTADPSPPAPAGDAVCITSFVFQVKNVPAALYKALGGFATNGVNMTKLESYAEGGTFTATMFYAEVAGRPEDAPLKRAFDELEFFTRRFEILGVYEAGPGRAPEAGGAAQPR
jgi:prephenate dehydratase